MERVEELAALNEIGAKVASTLDLDVILEYIMQKVKDVFGVEACSLMLLDEAEGMLRFKVSFGKGAEEVRMLSVPADRGLAGWMVKEKQPLLVHDVQKDPRFYGRVDRHTGLVTRSMIGTPLLVKERVIGVLEAINSLDGAFDAEDVRFLGSIATPLAQAIENARLFLALNEAYSDLLRRQQEIEQSRNLLRTIFDGIGDSVVIVDRDLRIVAGNVSAATTAGLTLDELPGSPFTLALRGLDRAQKDCPVRQTLESGERAQRVCRSAAKDGVHEWEIYTYPLLDEAGKASSAVVFGRDVTQEHRIEASLSRTAKLSAVGKLAAGTAHELGNPLTAVLGNAALLHRLSPRDSPTYSLATTILEAAERAKNIVRSLLDYARQDQYAFAPVEVNASLEWSMSLLKYSFDESVVRLEKKLAANLPRVLASESHLRTVWTNLLLNAVDATKAQAKRKPGFKGVVHLSSSYVSKQEAVRVVVRDNGTGIPDELMCRLFEPFFTTKKPSEGTGLGLYISHTVIDQHGGTIEVESSPGKGTQFTVTLRVGGPK